MVDQGYPIQVEYNYADPKTAFPRCRPAKICMKVLGSQAMVGGAPPYLPDTTTSWRITVVG